MSVNTWLRNVSGGRLYLTPENVVAAFSIFFLVYAVNSISDQDNADGLGKLVTAAGGDEVVYDPAREYDLPPDLDFSDIFDEDDVKDKEFAELSDEEFEELDTSDMEAEFDELINDASFDTEGALEEIDAGAELHNMGRKRGSSASAANDVVPAQEIPVEPVSEGDITEIFNELEELDNDLSAELSIDENAVSPIEDTAVDNTDNNTTITKNETGQHTENLGINLSDTEDIGSPVLGASGSDGTEIDKQEVAEGEVLDHDTGEVVEEEPDTIEDRYSYMDAPGFYEEAEIGSLSGKTRDFLEQVPADSLYEGSRALKPQETVSIEHGSFNNPFAGTEGETQDPTIGKDHELEISVKKKDMTERELLHSARTAMQTGQLETAITLYRQALDFSVKNETDDYPALFGLATAYHRNGQLSQARSIYMDLITRDQNNWPAMNNFLILASEESPEEALKELKALEKHNPEFAPIPAQVGMIYLQQDNAEQAAKHLTRAVILAPENIRYRYNLALVLDNLGETKLAAKLYTQLLEASFKGTELPESPNKIRNRLFEISSRQQ